MLRPGSPDDADALATIMAEPAIAAWWGHNDADSVRAELEAQVTYVVLIDGETAGWLHCNEETDPDYRHVSFDLAIATARGGQGYGREALRTAIGHFIAAGHHRFSIDPAADNTVAVRAYAAVGFKPVGILRRYERARDGRWRDGLLMDLLADELVEEGG